MINRRLFLASTTGMALAVGGHDLPAMAATGLRPNSKHDQSAALQKLVDHAVRKGRALHLPAGKFRVSNIIIPGTLQLSGHRGLTRLIGLGSEPILRIKRSRDVSLSGIIFSGSKWLNDNEEGGLVEADNAISLSISDCKFFKGRCSGLALRGCSGEVSRCEVYGQRYGGIFSLDGKGMNITNNHVHDVGDNGILVWQSKKREDGAVVAQNKVERIKGLSGGDGPYGNGILVYLAGSVTVTGNRISDCNFSAVRDNSGNNIIITSNNCSRLNEVAIFVEFAFQGAVVSDNLIEQAGMGIAITNYDHGGRLAVCTNNVVRGVFGARSNPETPAVGIGVEADTVVANNTIEDAPLIGLSLGWGFAMRNLAATGNVIRNTGIGIGVSVVKDAQKALIGNNVIAEAKIGGIIGMDHDRRVTKDLAKRGAQIPGKLVIERNLVT